MIHPGADKHEPVVDTGIKVNLPRLLKACLAVWMKYSLDPHNQIGLTHRINLPAEDRVYTGIGSLRGTTFSECDFSEFEEEFVGTYIHEVYQTLPYRIGRFRIMRIKPKASYSVHTDSSKRIHIPLITNINAFLLFPDIDRIVHMPADGRVFLADTTLRHTAVNCGTSDRLHLVGAIA
jgi:hypothetical protein